MTCGCDLRLDGSMEQRDDDQWPRMNLAAGPVEVTERTLRDMARPVLYHYDPAFKELFAHTSDLLQAGLPHRVRRRHHAGRGDPRARSGRGQSDRPGRQGAQPRLRRLRQVVPRSSSTSSAARRSSSPFPTTTRSTRRTSARRSTPTPASSTSRSSIPKRPPAPTTRSRRSATSPASSAC